MESPLFFCVRLFIYYYLSRVRGGGFRFPAGSLPLSPRVCVKAHSVYTHVTSKRTNKKKEEEEKKNDNIFPLFHPKNFLDFFFPSRSPDATFWMCFFFLFLSPSIGRWRVCNTTPVFIRNASRFFLFFPPQKMYIPFFFIFCSLVL